MEAIRYTAKDIGQGMTVTCPSPSNEVVHPDDHFHAAAGGCGSSTVDEATAASFSSKSLSPADILALPQESEEAQEGFIRLRDDLTSVCEKFGVAIGDSKFVERECHQIIDLSALDRHRLIDKVVRLEFHLRSLRAESKAREFRLEGALQENASLTDQAAKQAKDISAMTLALGASKRENCEARDVCEQHCVAHMEYEGKYAALHAEHQWQSAELSTTMTARFTSEAICDGLQAELTLRTDTLKATSAERDDLQQRLDEVAAILVKRNSELDSMRKQLVSAEAESNQRRQFSEELSAQVSALQAKFPPLQSKLVDAVDANCVLQKTMVTFQEEHARLRVQHYNMTHALRAAESRADLLASCCRRLDAAVEEASTRLQARTLIGSESSRAVLERYEETVAHLQHVLHQDEARQVVRTLGETGKEGRESPLGSSTVAPTSSPTSPTVVLAPWTRGGTPASMNEDQPVTPSRMVCQLRQEVQCARSDQVSAAVLPVDLEASPIEFS